MERKRRLKQYTDDRYMVRLDRIALYPEQGIRPTVDVFPAGRAAPFVATIMERHTPKTKAQKRRYQTDNPMFIAMKNGKEIILGSGTAVRPTKKK